MSGSEDITRLLAEWRDGNQAALNKLLPLVYDELHRIASYCMRREGPGHVLQTTALVNEAYLRVVKEQGATFQTRAHFYAIAAQVMRHVLVDYARARSRAKRGDGKPLLPLSDVAALSDDRVEELIAVDFALQNLAAVDPRKAKVFELRYFSGMSVEEVGEALKVSPTTVARDWRMAKSWLRREIAPGSQHAS